MSYSSSEPFMKRNDCIEWADTGEQSVLFYGSFIALYFPALWAFGNEDCTQVQDYRFKRVFPHAEYQHASMMQYLFAVWLETRY